MYKSKSSLRWLVKDRAKVALDVPKHPNQELKMITMQEIERLDKIINKAINPTQTKRTIRDNGLRVIS